MKEHLVNKFSSNHHPRKRNGDKINDCLCSRCFSQKCYAYEITISDIQNEYAYFKAYVEHKRGNKEVLHSTERGPLWCIFGLCTQCNQWWCPSYYRT